MRNYELYTLGPGLPIESSYASQTWVLVVRARSVAMARTLIRDQTAAVGNGAGIVSVKHNDWSRARRDWPWDFSVNLLGASED